MFIFCFVFSTVEIKIFTSILVEGVSNDLTMTVAFMTNIIENSCLSQ